MTNLGNFWERKEYWESAIQCYQKCLEADNLAEGIYRKLMLCYQKLERLAEAIETYERCRKAFLAVLKIEPSPETTLLYQNLLQNVTR